MTGVLAKAGCLINVSSILTVRIRICKNACLDSDYSRITVGTIFAGVGVGVYDFFGK
jgi:hypothetical protein